MKGLHALAIFVFTVLLSLIPAIDARAGQVVLTPEKGPKISGPVLDAAASADGKFLFFLTPGQIIVYDSQKGLVVNRSRAETAYDALTYADGPKTLILTSSRGKEALIYRIETIYDIALDGLPTKGPRDAPVTIAVFSDYQCPYCARIEGFLQQVMARYPGKIRFAMKHFPLSSHKFARQASLAALAADRQGKFWDFHEALFKNNKALDSKKILEIAKSLKLDVDRWQKDMDDPVLEEIIDRDIEDGRRIGVQGTPTIMINGKEARMRSPEDFTAQVEAEMAEAPKGKTR